MEETVLLKIGDISIMLKEANIYAIQKNINSRIHINNFEYHNIIGQLFTSFHFFCKPYSREIINNLTETNYIKITEDLYKSRQLYINGTNIICVSSRSNDYNKLLNYEYIGIILLLINNGKYEQLSEWSKRLALL